MFRKSLHTSVLLVVLALAFAGCTPATPQPAAGPAAPAPATAVPVALQPAAAPTAAPAPTSAPSAPAVLKKLQLLAPDLGKPVELAPKLSWQPLPGIGTDQYRVLVVDRGTTEPAVNQVVTGVEYAVAQPLKPGRDYTLLVQALDGKGQPVAEFSGDFKTIGTPAAPGTEPFVQLPATCYREGLLTYVDQANSFCFAYPQGFTVLANPQGSQAQLEVRGPAIGAGPEPLFASLSVEVKPYQGMDLAPFVDQYLKDNVPANFPAKVERKQATFGGEPAGHGAIVLEPMPGRLSSRVAVVDFAPQSLFVMTFWPSFKDTAPDQINAEGKQAQKDMEALYEIVSSSFATLPPAGVPIAAQARVDVPRTCMVSGQPLFIDTNDNYCFALPPDITPRRLDNGRLEFNGPALDQSPEPLRVGLSLTVEVAVKDAVLDKIVKDYLASFKELASTIQAGTLTLDGGTPAVRLDGVPGRPTTIQIFALHEGTLFQFSFSPDLSFAKTKDQTSLLIQAVTRSFGFLPKPAQAGGPAVPAASPAPAKEPAPVAAIELDPNAVPGVLGSYKVEQEPAVLPGDNINLFDTHPAQAVAKMAGYNGGQTYDMEPSVTVYRVADLQAFVPNESPLSFMKQYETLKRLLADRAPLSACSGVTWKAGETLTPVLPFLPAPNSSQVFCVQASYVDYPGVKGVRYVTAFTQSFAMLFSDKSVFYTFQGLTDDGQYYVSVVFPMNTGMFPAKPGDGFDPDNWLTVLKGQVDKVAAFKGGEFSPSLSKLDGLIGTLSVSAPVAQAAEPVAGTNSATYGGVSFSYPATLAQVTRGQAAPAQDLPGPSWAVWPAHVEIELTGYVLPRTSMTPRVAVYPAAEYAKLSEQTAAQIDGLKQLLARKTAEPADLPFLPLIGGKQAMHFGVKYVEFAGGAGVRYLTQYNQGPVPINNEDLIYTFQGLTADGKYYVSAILPVSHGSLPANSRNLSQADYDALVARYQQYIKDTAAALAGQPDASFKPALDGLDALVASIKLDPAAVDKAIAAAPKLSGEANVAPGVAEYQGISFGYAAALAKGSKGETIPAGPKDGPWYANVPEHREISLTGYVIPKASQAPRIIVYPIVPFYDAAPQAAAPMIALKRLLDEPANPTGELPFLPLIDAKQAMHFGLKYLGFGGGQGIRYLTMYSQGPVPVNNGDLFYTFQGLTSDGNYYVAAILPVSHASLPASPASLPQADLEALIARYPQYMKDTTAALAAQLDNSFTPSLADLDALVQSISVNP